jgi:hypothetical protein
MWLGRDGRDKPPDPRLTTCERTLGAIDNGYARKFAQLDALAAPHYPRAPG